MVAAGSTGAAAASWRSAGSGFLRLDRAAQAVPIGLSADAVGLGVLDRRRVTLDADPELEAQVERFLIAEPELSAKLVDADLLGQLALRSSLPGRARRQYWPPARSHILAHRHRYREPGREILTQVVPGQLPLPGRKPARQRSQCRSDSSDCSRCTAAGAMATRSARENAPRRAARSMHVAESRHSQAPLPGAVRLTTRAPVISTIRISSSAGAGFRQPTQVRTGRVGGESVVTPPGSGRRRSRKRPFRPRTRAVPRPAPRRRPRRRPQALHLPRRRLRRRPQALHLPRR